MDCPPVRAQAWLDEHEGEIADLRVEEVVALVEGAGLQARVLPHATGWAAEEQRGDRVTLRLTAAGELASADAG